MKTSTTNVAPQQNAPSGLRGTRVSCHHAAMDMTPVHSLDPDGVGRRIQDARVRCGWSVNQLALRCDCTRQSIEAYEGGVNLPGSKMLARLSLALGVTADDLLGLPRLRGAS